MNRFFTQIIGIITLLCFQISATAQDFTQLGQYLDTLSKYEKFMGSVAIAREGKVIYEKTVGSKNMAQHIKAAPNDMYRLGSISKTYTATLILKAAEEGKLNLSDKIDTYFSKLQHADAITIMNLLNHSSGIYNLTNSPDYLSYHTKKMSRAQLLDTIMKYTPESTPNSAPSYSNSNYILLTMILEKVYNESYDEILQNKIIKPLGLKNTAVGTAINTKKNQVLSYEYNDTWTLSDETDMSIPLGAGAVIASASDVAHFFHALFNGKIINKASLSQMTTMNKGYGLGLFPMPYNEETGYGHTGGIDGFTSMAAHFEDKNYEIVILSNGNNYNLNNIGLAMLDVLHDKKIEIPKLKFFKVDPSIVPHYVGTYASAAVPLKINIFQKEGKLHAQADGQNDFPLTATDLHTYEFAPASIKILFDVDKKTMTLIQGGMEFTFDKQ